MNNSNSKVIEPGKTTVGEIVANNYNAAGIFRQYGMDFCCGGGITLQKACEKRDVELSEILNELQKLNGNAGSVHENYSAWEPAHLIDHIEQTHHNFVRSKTGEISIYAAKVAKVHGERRPENIEIYELFQTLCREMLNHLEAEEERVFPLIRKIYETRMRGEAVPDEIVNALREEILLMEDDHEEVGNVMKKIRDLSNQFTPPEGACATYRVLYQNLEGFEQDLHKHVHLENNILFKKAEKLIA